MIQLLIRLFRKQLIKHLYTELCKPINNKPHEYYAFCDNQGRAYYHYKGDDLPYLPLMRFAKLNQYFQELAFSMSSESWDKLLDGVKLNIEASLNSTKDRGSFLAKAIFLINDAKERKGQLITEEIFWNIIACMYIRSDENSFEFNQVVHDEKIETLKALKQEGGLRSFFALLSLKELLPFMELSGSEFQTWLDESQQKIVALNKLMNILATAE